MWVLLRDSECDVLGGSRGALEPSSSGSRRTAACRTPAAGRSSASSARRDPSLRRRVASLGLVDPAAGKRFLIDATPDFADQMERLGGLPDGILLTHAHIGHYLGLAQLGREVLDARRVPVYATARDGAIPA